MLRKLLLPIAAATLVAGCVTTDYGYRGGRGDYYYGQPSTEYRYYGGYGHPYGYPSYGYYGYPYGYHYGSPYYGYPYRSRYPHYHYQRPYPGYPYTQPQPGTQPPTTRPPGSDDRPAWRNFDELRRRKQGIEGVQPRLESQPRIDRPAPAMAMPRPVAEPRERSRMAEMYRRNPQEGERRPRSSDEP